MLTSTLAGCVSGWVLTLTMPWFVFATTGSAGHAGIVVFAELAPFVVARFLAGPVVDRLGLRRTSWMAGVVETSSVVLIAVLVALDMLSFPMLLALVASMGAANGAGLLAKGFLAPAAAKYIGVDEGRAISLSSATLTVGRVFGPSLGALLAARQPVVGLAVVAVLAAVSASIIGLALPHGMEPGPAQMDEGEERQGYWRSLGEGVGYFRRDSLLVRLYVMLSLMAFLVAPMTSVFLPVWAKETTAGPGAIGALISTGAFASFLGSVVAVSVIERVRPSVILAVGFLLVVPQLLTLALGAPMWLVMVAWAVAGFVGAFPDPVIGKITHLWPSEEFRSRVRALGGAIATLGSALGSLVAGVFVDRFGLAVPLIAASVLYLLVTQGTVFRKDMRRLTPKIREDRPE
ncbi:MFS transporter [Streptomyces oryzae]|uniref:Multidrug efflux pump Tap n=1 Tax=Streptomyces oryzae TaxID=1434886 RepID=A0ABS3XMY6_9ACTN|nr:MFS transporter [Streptomyces oryzae]MBO8196674.1 MFS transporter [Streptomyces oryzae]